MCALYLYIFLHNICIKNCIYCGVSIIRGFSICFYRGNFPGKYMTTCLMLDGELVSCLVMWIRWMTILCCYFVFMGNSDSWCCSSRCPHFPLLSPMHEHEHQYLFLIKFEEKNYFINIHLLFCLSSNVQLKFWEMISQNLDIVCYWKYSIQKRSTYD